MDKTWKTTDRFPSLLPLQTSWEDRIGLCSDVGSPWSDRCNAENAVSIPTLSRHRDDLHLAVTIDSRSATFVCLLDLSVAFDTVDDEILLTRNKKKTYCFSWSTLKCLGTYLANRSFQVRFANQQSSPIQLKFRVPQGSVIGRLAHSCLMSTRHNSLRWLLDTIVSEKKHLCGRQSSVHALSTRRHHDGSIQNWVLRCWD